MLFVPSFRRIGETTVYQDDTEWFRFYLVPPRPSVRTDKNGAPVFLLATYGTSAQVRAEDATRERGGGFMNFDVQFALTPAEVAAAREELQVWVDAEYARRKTHVDYKDLPDYAGPAAPQVVIADPMLSGGTVSMQTTQSEALTTARFAEAPASLVAGSTAVFNVDLTADGAAFMRDLMIDSSGSGAIDLTPLQVIYDMRMWARLPPVQITVEADSKRIHDKLKTVSENNRDSACTPREIESYREDGLNSSKLTETGDVKVTLNKGDAALPEEAFQALQNYALDLFDTMVEERFLQPAKEDDQPLEFDSTDPALNEQPASISARVYTQTGYRGDALELGEDAGSLDLGRSVRTGASRTSRSVSRQVRSIQVTPGHRLTLYSGENFTGRSRQFSSSARNVNGVWKSARVWRPPVQRKKVRKTFNESTMELKVVLDRSQVVEWPVGGQATLETFFSGMSKAEIARHVRHVEANFFDSLNVDVRALVDFAGGPYQAVEVQCKYEAEDENGDPFEFHDSFTFVEGESASARFDPRVVNGHQEYSFRYRLIFDDGQKTDFEPWQTASNRSLNISVTDPARLTIDVSAASINWEVVRSVALRLVHGDGAQKIEKTLELTNLAPSAKIDERLLGDPASELQIQTTYILADGKVVDAEPVARAVTDTLYVVAQPQVDVLDVSLAASGDWEEVVQAVVQLEYERADGRVYDKTFRMKSIEDFATWQVLLDDPHRRRFRYQQLVIYKNGEQEQSDWIEKDGDQTLLIRARGVERLKLTLLPTLLDFSKTPVVTVTVNYAGQSQTFVFTEKGDKSFSAPVPADGSREYVYEVTWHLADGSTLAQEPKRTTETSVLLTKPDLPEPGTFKVQVRGFAVDFAATPFVDVELTVNRDNGGAHVGNIALSDSNANDEWTFSVDDVRDRSYRYAITYNLANGERVDGPSGQTDESVISITALQQ